MSLITESKVIIGVGGGISSEATAVQTLLTYGALFKQRSTDTPPLDYVIVDRNGHNGGTPYRTNDRIRILNQFPPAMSPLAQYPNHFTEWLGGNEYRTKFVPRAVVKDYSNDLLLTTVRQLSALKIPIGLHRYTGSIETIGLGQHKAILGFNNGYAVAADAAVLAPGHVERESFPHLKDKKGYFGGFYSIDDVDECLTEKTKRIAMVGGNAAMFDALRVVVKGLGYKNQIDVFTTGKGQPWLYDERYDPDHPVNKTRYEFSVLTPENIKNNPDTPLENLMLAEFEKAKQTGRGPGHVLGQINLDDLKTAGPDGTKPKDYDQFIDVYHSWYGNPTPRKSLELLQNCVENKQLTFHKRRVDENDVTHEPETGFKVQGIEQPYDLVFNCAPFDPDPLAPPVLQQVKEHLIFKDDGHIQAGRQKHPLLHVVGVSTSRKKGIESYRRGYLETGFDIIETVYNLDTRPTSILELPPIPNRHRSLTA